MENTGELLERAVEEARVLVRAEAALAQERTIAELHALHESYASFLLSAACVVIAQSAIVAAVVAASGAVTAAIVSAALLLAAAVFAYAGHRRWAKLVTKKGEGDRA